VRNNVQEVNPASHSMGGLVQPSWIRGNLANFVTNLQGFCVCEGGFKVGRVQRHHNITNPLSVT
jgi:hypothetical protein